jgi:uncharacterized protein (DUF488 family)
MLIYTLGHSSRSIEKFIQCLKGHQVQLLVDIRTIPKSAKNPQYNQDSLRDAMAEVGIEYIHLKSLGGLRRTIKESKNIGWENPSFRGFADYMQTTEFEDALNNLIELGRQKQAAIMCAEGNPYRCHRSLVSDALLVRGIEVRHISSAKSASPHRLTSFAEVDGFRVSYPEIKK